MDLGVEVTSANESNWAGWAERMAAEVWLETGSDGVGLERTELARVLELLGKKYQGDGSEDQARSFWRGLQLRDLALAQACALGRAAAWEQFMARFRAPLRQAATGMTGSATEGEELADALYSELYGMGGKSPLAAYAGRGSLMGFLRTTLAQRRVDGYRKTQRETPIGERDFAAAPLASGVDDKTVARVEQAVSEVLGELGGEESFLLSAWYLDGRTLQEMGRVLRVHEATISRKLKRATEELQKALLKKLQAAGMTKGAAVEALGTDPRDLTIDVKSLLQKRPRGAFLGERAEGDSV